MNIKTRWLIFKVILIGLMFITFFYLATYANWEQQYILGGLLFTGLLLVLSHETTVSGGSNLKSSITLPMIIPALYLFGPFWGCFAAFIGTIQPNQLRRDYQFSNFLANRSLMFISTAASALWLNFVDYREFDWGQTWVLLVMGATFTIVNSTLLWLGLMVVGRENPEDFLLFTLERGKSVLISTLIAVVFIIVYQSHGIPGILILFILVYLFKDVLQARLKHMNSFYEVIESFARVIDTKDPYTRGHSERVARYVYDLAKSIHMSPIRIARLVQVAKLHDVGKLGIPDYILLKPGNLDPAELEEIRKHPYRGEELLEGIDMLKEFLPVIRYHHEHYDGTGYPEGLTGDEIPLEARVLTLADAFDSMTTDRVYRKALSKEEVLQELKSCAGNHFDSELVSIFQQFINDGRYDDRFQS